MGCRYLFYATMGMKEKKYFVFDLKTKGFIVKMKDVINLFLK